MRSENRIESRLRWLQGSRHAAPVNEASVRAGFETLFRQGMWASALVGRDGDGDERWAVVTFQCTTARFESLSWQG